MESQYYPLHADHTLGQWYLPEFFQWHGELTEQNVMEYFEASPFYDRSSNNQVLRMQTMHAAPEHQMNIEEELKRFIGMEYALVHAEAPGFFLIQQQDRVSPTQVRPMGIYMILNGAISQAPDLYTVLSTRLMNALNMIQSSLDTLREARPDYTPRIGHIWPILDPPSVSKREKATTRPGSAMPEGIAAEGSSPTKPPEMKLPKQGESEAAQPWEPFYNAFTFTMNEVLRKRPQRTVPVAMPKLAVPISEVESHTQPDHLTGKRPSLAKSGGKTSVARLAEKAAQGAGTSAYGDKPGVPTVDGSHKKKKGQPGPPGQPGAGKKKLRRIAAQEAKKAALAQGGSFQSRL